MASASGPASRFLLWFPALTSLDGWQLTSYKIKDTLSSSNWFLSCCFITAVEISLKLYSSSGHFERSFPPTWKLQEGICSHAYSPDPFHTRATVPLLAIVNFCISFWNHQGSSILFSHGREDPFEHESFPIMATFIPFSLLIPLPVSP